MKPSGLKKKYGENDFVWLKIINIQVTYARKNIL